MSHRWRACLAVLSIACGASAGADEWVAARSPHFLVVSDAGEKTARNVARRFEQVQALFETSIQARVDPGRPTVVLAVKDEEGMKDLLPNFWEKKGRAHPAGVFVGGWDKHYVVLRTDVPGTGIVFHEYVHVLNSLNFKRLPLWLDEGLAEFFATAQIGESEVRVGVIAPHHIELLRRKPLLPLDVLLAVDHFSPHYNEADRVSIFYAEATALTHYLMLGEPSGKAQATRFLALLRLLQEEVDDDEALRRVFGDLKTLEKGLASYVRHVQFPFLTGSATIGEGRVATLRLSTGESLAIRGDFLVHSGRLAEASTLLEKARQLDAGIGLVHESLGLLSLRQGRPSEALRFFQEAVRLAPQDYIAHFWAGVATPRSAESFAAKEACLRRAAELNPSFVPAYAELADLFETDERRREEGLTLARKACALERSNAYGIRLSRLLRATGRTEEAEQVEQRIARSALSDPRVLLTLVHSYKRTSRHADAEALLRKARDAHPRNVLVIYQLGSFLAEQKKYDEAEAAFRQALSVQPQSALVLNGLGYMNADRGVRVEEALDFIDKALAQEPRNGAFLDSRGWALFRLGRLPEAEECLRKSLASVEDAAILDHLGDVLERHGALREALDMWRRALAREGIDADLKASIERKVRAAQPALENLEKPR